MKFDIKSLQRDVGLKIDELLFLGRDNVEKAILEHSNIFEGIDVFSVDKSHMLYGYNKSGNPVKLGFDGDLVNRIVISTESNERLNYKCVISYDGHKYNGFQIQKDKPTIQGKLTEIISAVNGIETLIKGASRTDAGVHALNYVFNFYADKRLTKEKWIEYLNYQLPNDILVKSVEEVHPLFHSRYDVYKKKYVYKIFLKEKNPFKINYEWFVEELDENILKENLEQLVGTHDFTSFCKGQFNSTIRTIYKTDLIRNGNELVLVFEGNGFLRYMIRIIVEALVQIAKGNIDKNIADILKEKSRKFTKNMAPACGLYLEEIVY